MKKPILLLLPLILALGACNNKNNKPSWGETSTKTIVFKGDKNRSGLGSGSQLGTEAFDNALTSLINEQADNSLTKLGGKKCGTQLVGGDSGTDTSLTIGTGSYDGLIYLTFNLDIVKIDVTLQNYYKPHHDYQTNQDVSGIDANAEATICSYDPSGDGTVIEQKEIDLSTEDVVNVPAEREETLELKEKTNTIAFYNSAEKHRTYIHSLTVTYLVK
ncbi:MAG: hypothetical protein J5511_05605 [Bacilli bacterium]|nr:hypothetical protein [Bacilli bacterium]